ncbi:hypothetical protein DV735_g5311, partial [Chaetothyriales sp. CBS 134920]
MEIKMGPFEVEDILSKLTVEEKIALLSGTGIAATWDLDLVQQSGKLQGLEAIAKGASVVLGPTVNMQRGPTGGRGFESFSEDPYLSGTTAAATINGMQSTGVAATIKHLVCNDLEHERMSINAIVSERALREIYLLPFQIALRESDPWCVMAAYNRVNGTHASESPKILKDILREDWGFKGLVMSDWFGVYSTVESIQAGLDLEMPGPSYIRGNLVSQALRSRKLRTADIDACVRRILQLVKQVAPLGIPENAEEKTRDTPETSALLRKVSAEGIVLLKNGNYNKVLPFSKEKTTAVIGPNAALAAYSGGGSANLDPYYAVSPLQGIRGYDKTAKYSLGAPGWNTLPLMTLRTKSLDGKQGLTMKIFLDPPTKSNRQEIAQLHIAKSDCLLADYNNPGLPKNNIWWADLQGTFTPDESAEYELSVIVAGIAKVFVNGKLVVDNETKQRPGPNFFGTGTVEEKGALHLEAGKTYDILVNFGTLPLMKTRSAASLSFGAGAFRLGLEKRIDHKVELDRAVKLAREVDQVVLCMGLNKDWESEGYDRKDINLPPGSDDLIKAVCAANPNTAVILQSGTPVSMPWIDAAPAIVQAWYGGNETGNAIADVVYGHVNPSGKLPLSFPHRNEDNPAFLNFRSERGQCVYGEGVYIGYRFYEKTKKEIAFPFGHGLSYTTFSVANTSVISDGDDGVVVSASVSNTGSVDGAEVVQIYVSQHKPSINRPVKELKGFKKVFVKAGAEQRVEIPISKKFACSFWDEDAHSWIMEKDGFDVLLGTSSASVQKVGEISVAETKYWSGLHPDTRSYDELFSGSAFLFVTRLDTELDTDRPESGIQWIISARNPAPEPERIKYQRDLTRALFGVRRRPPITGDENLCISPMLEKAIARPGESRKIGPRSTSTSRDSSHQRPVSLPNPIHQRNRAEASQSRRLSIDKANALRVDVPDTLAPSILQSSRRGKDSGREEEDERARRVKTGPFGSQRTSQPSATNQVDVDDDTATTSLTFNDTGWDESDQDLDGQRTAVFRGEWMDRLAGGTAAAAAAASGGLGPVLDGFSDGEDIYGDDPLHELSRETPSRTGTTPSNKKQPAKVAASSDEGAADSDAQNPFAPSAAGTKRTHEEIDYDRDELAGKSYTDLDKVPFLTDPRAPPPTAEAEAEETTGSAEHPSGQRRPDLDKQLEKLSELAPADQVQLLQSLGEAENEQAGAWFAAWFGESVKQVQQLRLQRRKTALKYEMEARKRQRAVEAKMAQCEAQLADMKQAGSKLVAGRSADGLGMMMAVTPRRENKFAHT